MRTGTIRRTRVIATRQGQALTHDPRVRYLPTEHGHAARPGLAQATRVYQSDASSKRPASSVVSAASLKAQRPPPTRERRKAVAIDSGSFHISFPPAARTPVNETGV
jgi:hypothetical protein